MADADDVRRFRERRGLERRELAELLNDALGTSYNTESVGRWERDTAGGRPVPKKVRVFLDELSAQDAAATFSGGSSPTGLEPDDEPLEPPGVADTAPGGPAMPAASPKLGGAGAWSRACEELWELVATGIGMVGAATSNPALMRDGEIIAADKAALGAAWGRLAETNDTFRRMLVGMTEGGVWLQVAMVTGTTLSKCWQSHQEYAAYLRRQRQELELDGVGEPAAAAA